MPKTLDCPNCGAPLEAKNDYGGTVLDFVVWVARNQRRDDVDHPAVVALLVAAGAEVGDSPD